MPRTLDELFRPDANQRLFQMLFRHQVYLEGAKGGFADDYRQLLFDLYAAFGKLFRETRYTNIDEYTIGQLKEFIRKFTSAQGQFYSAYTQRLINLLKDFLMADIGVMTDIYSEASGVNFATAQGYAAKSIVGTVLTHKDRDKDRDALWAKVSKSVVPATGKTLQQMLDSLSSNSQSAVIAVLMKAYANHDSMDDTMTALVGSRSLGYRDGLFNRLFSAATSTLATVVQHVSASSQSVIGTAYGEEYQWVAIIDNKTTVICQERNGNIYVWGIGPLPPAHYFCRSKAISILISGILHEAPDTLLAGLQLQSLAFLSDVYSPEIAAKIKSGKARQQDFTKIVISSLTVMQFAERIKFITQE